MKSAFAAVTAFIFINFSASAAAQSQLSQAMRDMQTLSDESMQGRELGTEGSTRAQNYILKRLNEMGLKACGESFIQEFSFSDRHGNTKVGRNILACQNTSSSDINKNSSIVVSAHYDHLGVQNGATYFGADDNASGVAGVLAVAQTMMSNAPDNNIIYAFFDGEELGLVGSHAFVKHAPVALNKIAIDINFDMIARGDKNELYVSGTSANPTYKKLLEGLNGTQGVKLLFGHDTPEEGTNDWTQQSDQFPFVQAGIPHLYFGVEDHNDYHKPSDTADKINQHFFDASIAIICKAVSIVDHALTIDDSGKPQNLK